MPMDEAERPVDDVTMRRWAELALTVRSYGQVISTVSTPRPGTAFAAADSMYPTESMSQWCREGMRSALDHLGLWAAAAHGKDWAIRELQVLTGEPYEWRPGQFHFQDYVDPEKLTEMLSDTLDLVAVALHRYLARAYDGDVKSLLQRAIYEAARLTPQMDDGSHIRRIAAEMGIEDP